jgi:hypothetical protein
MALGGTRLWPKFSTMQPRNERFSTQGSSSQRGMAGEALDKCFGLERCAASQFGEELPFAIGRFKVG